MKSLLLRHWILLALPLTGLLTLYFYSTRSLQSPFAPATTELQLENAKLRTLQGEEFKLSKYQGRPVLVNLWAYWCHPCVTEIPELEKLKAALPELAVVLVHIGQTGEAIHFATELWKEKNLTLENYYDTEQKLRPAFNLESLPVTLLFDSQHRVQYRINGELAWSQNRIQREIRKKLLEVAR